MVDEGSSEYSWITKNYDLITENNINDFLIVRSDGSLNLEWPKYGGLELNTIDSVDSLSGKIQVSRSGSDGGCTIGYIQEEGGMLAMYIWKEEQDRLIPYLVGERLKILE